MVLDELKENLEAMRAGIETELGSANEIKDRFINCVCDSSNIENYLKGIFYSSLFEQFWAMYGLMTVRLNSTSTKKIEGIFNDIIGQLPHQESGKIEKISANVKLGTLYRDIDEKLEDPSTECCEFELGCIGGKYLAEHPALPVYPFLSKLSKPQKDHVWPKSRTPVDYILEDVDHSGMILCEYHNKNKMTSMRSVVFKLLNE
jgi:hypothetical protein